VREAEHHLALARRLDPLYINTRFHVAGLCLQRGQLQQAQVELDAITDIAPDSMPVAGMSGLLAMLRGDGPAALEHYRRACALAPDHAGCYASLAAAQGFVGDREAADMTMAELTARFGTDATSPYILAIVATRCARHDQAFELLQRAVEIPDPSAVILPVDPSFASLRSDSRWPGLMAALKKPIRS
jgi:Tfp pilus assembly protein PilF